MCILTRMDLSVCSILAKTISVRSAVETTGSLVQLFHIRVRVNNEKNGGVKKAPQARGGRPLRSINVSYPFVCHFHPLQLYVSRLPK